MTVQISHDPFARHTIVRQLVESRDGCAWCGNRRRSGKLFQYGTEPDGLYGRIAWHKGLFCSKQCHDNYHMM